MRRSIRRSMRRLGCAIASLSLAGGCCSTSPTADYGASVGTWGHHGSNTLPGCCGPQGESLPMAGPYASNQPGNPWAAQRMMAGGMGMPPMPGMMPGMPPMPGMLPGMPAGMPGMPPGMMPPPSAAQRTAMNGYGNSGIMQAAYNVPVGPARPGMGAMAAGGQGAVSGVRFESARTQVRFARPTDMKVAWFTQGPDGEPSFSSTPLKTPGRYNFGQGAIYRLKISSIEGRPGLEVYPTMEVVPSNPKTEAFLAHSSVPVDFTPEDFKQIVEGNYVVKVIYLPDPQFQDITSSGTEEILSTRLEPGVDPIAEAMRRGSILLVVRMGNVDQEAPNTPPLGAAPPGAGPAMMKAYGPQYPVPPGAMVPFGAVPPGTPGSIGIPPQGFMVPPGMQPPVSANPALSAGPMMMPPTASGPNGPGTLPNFGNAGSMPPPQLGPLFTPPPASKEAPPTSGVPVSNPEKSSNTIIVPNTSAIPPAPVSNSPALGDGAPIMPPASDLGPTITGPSLTPNR